MKRTSATLAVGLATAALCCSASPSYASPDRAAGCPPGNGGFVLWDVSAEPYGVDNAVDEKGNNDGWVCARPIYTVTDENGDPFQIYNFIDNRFG